MTRVVSAQSVLGFSPAAPAPEAAPARAAPAARKLSGKEALQAVVKASQDVQAALKAESGGGPDQAAAALETVPAALCDEDAAALFRDQGGVEAVCACMLKFPAACALPALLALQLLATQERSAAAMLRWGLVLFSTSLSLMEERDPFCIS